MNNARNPRWSAALLLWGLAALAGCTSQADLRKAELADLSVVLPGAYANPKQALLILNVFAPMLPEHVLYVRETAADDPRRIFSERVWILEIGGTGKIVATVYAFAEPDHWRGAAEDPELFRPLLLRDLRPLAGCELIWEKTLRGFSAAGATSRCPQSWRLDSEELAFSVQPGAAAAGASDSYFHFVRQGSPQ